MVIGRTCRVIAISAVLLYCAGNTASAQKAGIKSITAEELRLHLGFVASDETEGRGTPSTGGNIVAKYLAIMAAGAGLKPIMPDGSFFQDIRINAPTISESRSRLLVKGAAGEAVFYPSKDFGGNLGRVGKAEGGIIFVGAGLQAPQNGWNDYAGLDLKGKVVVALDAQLPAGHAMTAMQVRMTKLMTPLTGGAAAILTVINPERERDLQTRGAGLAAILQPTREDQNPGGASPALVQSGFPIMADVRHAVATRILDITKDELNAMFASLAEGKQVPGREMPSRLELTIEADARRDRIRNVLAVAEGTDPVLKKEYVVISAHYDHLGIRNGRSMNGANDNASGTVAMLEIAQALMIQRPKRSVILAWFAGEEMGLWGSNQFVNRPPVPIEAISADVNLDMIGRNDPGVLFLIGTNSLSTELDEVLRKLGEQPFGLKLDYTYNDKNHPEHYYNRSDHYSFIRMGVPAVCLFTGITPDYHQAGDAIEKIDFTKMERIARFTYAAALEVGNRPELLKLDADPTVTARGQQNLKIPAAKP
jgi:hypothetical protein